ncbi:hypothetical protein BJ165DRAFT_1477986 [Panaeolus papilionaceus]|nr:hypothetical protein BJ165DRAFT_1477986 [Panaeolus papilionaceus]
MGSVCLSSASTLRCASLSKIENVILVVPPALEVIFSTSLIFMKWGSGRRYLLLTAEGWVYLLLALMELVANIVPAVRDNLSLFRNFDRGIGVTSFLPIFFYTFFLYLFTGSELVETLPYRIKRGSRLILIIFIPVIVIFNETASFIGISIGQVTVRRASTVVVGFASKREEELWTFFTSVTLAVLTLFQAIVFSITFFRLFQALGHQRRIEEKKTDMAHLIKGAAWISAAVKLGAIETVVGFGGGGFGVALTRRILRLLSRACLCIGLVKGLDSVEDFRNLRTEVLGIKNSKQEWRGSRLRQFISNPRLSTFRQLSPTAAAFHAIPRAPSALLGAMNSDEKPAVISDALVVPTPIPSRALMNPTINAARRKSKLEKPRPRNSTYSTSAKSFRLQENVPTMDQFVSLKEKVSRQRVTVLYNGGAPTLHMRFSTLDVLNPENLVSDKLSSRAPSSWDEEVYGPGYDRNTGFGVGYVDKLNKDSDRETVSDEDSAKGFVFSPMYQTLKPPQPVLNRDSVGSVPSHTGPIEIIATPRRTISVTKAPQAMVYRTSKAAGSPIDEESGLPTLQEAKLTRHPTDASLETISERSSEVMTRTSRKSSAQGRSKSASMASQADSLQAVHDLAAQFPGPPTFSLSQLHALKEEPLSAASSSTVYPDVVVLPRAPSRVSEFGYNRNRDTVSEYPDEDASWGNSHHSSFALTPRTATRHGDTIPEVPPLTQQQRDMRKKSLDPFADTESNTEDQQLPPSQPRYIVPTGQPLREALAQGEATPSSGFPSSTYRQRNMSYSEGMVEALSAFPIRGQSPSGSDNPYMDLGTALDSGKSRLFKSMQQSPSSGIRLTDQGVLGGATNKDKLARTAQWVDATILVTPPAAAASASLGMTQEEKNAALMIQPAIRSASLQNLHDRGKSIDAMTIGWLKGVDRNRTPPESLGSPDERMVLRVKSVGKAPRKSTPTPTHTRGHSKVSMHLEPIIIPPRGNLQVIAQDGDIGATPTPSATVHKETGIVEVSRI